MRLPPGFQSAQNSLASGQRVSPLTYWAQTFQ